MLDLQIVLIIIIAILALNLIYMGYLVARVLKRATAVLDRALEAINNIDANVQNGLEKAKELEKPLHAISETTKVVSDIVHGPIARKAASSIRGVISHRKNKKEKNLYKENAQ